MTTPTAPVPAPRPRRRLVTAGVVAASLSIAGAGAALADDDTATTVDVEASMPEGYTQAQYDAFWGAGYAYADVVELGALWSTDDTETKSRAGQMILDGLTVPVAPSGPDEVETAETAEPSAEEGAPAEAVDDASYSQAQYDAFWGAGYAYADVVELGALWSTDDTETKSRAGQMILDGQTPPIAPTGTPASTTIAP